MPYLLGLLVIILTALISFRKTKKSREMKLTVKERK